MLVTRTRMLNLLILALAMASTLLSPCRAQDEDEDFPPGLLAKYSVGDQSVERIDSVVSFDWGADSPDERLPQGSFSAEWKGNLLVRVPGKHQFHAFVSGDVSVSVDGEQVLEATHQWGFVSGPEVTLSSGDHKISVTYRTLQDSDKTRSRVALFWSSDTFTLEPLPADTLFRDETSQAWGEAQGRLHADANRCVACHQPGNEMPVLKAPALDRILGSQSVDTLTRRLINPQAVVANSHMPNFGLTNPEVESVVAYLLSASKETHTDKVSNFKDGDVAKGTKLLNSLGCVACHAVPGVAASARTLAAPYEGPELNDVGKRRPAAWIERWLKSPESLNADHRMPVFELSKDERRQLTAALVDGHGTPGATSLSPQSDPVRIAQGKAVIESANCAACHTIPGIKAMPMPSAIRFEGNAIDCLRPHRDSEPVVTDGKRIPHFRLEANTVDTIRDWFATSHDNSAINASDRGQLLLNRNGCLACHDRNLNRGLSTIARRQQKTHPELAGQSQSLVPPPLTAVGDKLMSDYLHKAVAGEQKDRRLPWLLVRMPKFRHSDADRAAIVQHLISSDRIPDQADAARADVLAHIDVTQPKSATTEDLVLGNQLTGAGGFNCVACHSAGPFQPRNVALGTRGSDIMTMGKRIRPRYFQRWMKNPIRVVAGIEMPAIKKAMPDVLDGSVPRQMVAIWKALSDEGFTPPTVTSRFEQVVNVAPGESPKIIRDVFTIGVDADRDAVARAMAIGFDNGHNILIDLDTMQVRLWTMGEFARQRTEGKSWYWDMPGIIVRRAEDTSAAWQLTMDGDTLFPVPDEGRYAELLDYQQSASSNAVELTCRWRFRAESDVEQLAPKEPHFSKSPWEQPRPGDQSVIVQHRFEPAAIREGETQTGWKHSVGVVEAPAGSVLVGRLGANGEVSADRRDLIAVKQSAVDLVNVPQTGVGAVTFTVPKADARVIVVPSKRAIVADSDTVTSTPGFLGTRLPLDKSIMPTSLAWLDDGRMVFTSLKGHVWVATDSNGDGIADKTELFEEGLSAPFGILADGNSIVVAHKPEILRLRDTNDDGRADRREVVASGWGYSDNYHDWASGLIRDDDGNMYVGLGSDYSQKGRSADHDRWRGGVIRINTSGSVTPLAMSMRYPMSLAFDHNGNLFATDNQGVQNTFNEINHIQLGKHYGVPSRNQPDEGLNPESPALAVPHPWTRSVNSILFLPRDFPVVSLRGHGIGCEYDSRFLIRFTVQNVGGTLQGASYYFSRPNQEAGVSNFIGPICSAVAPDGAIFIGSIWDSGWQGGQNNGGITRLVPAADGLPNGIREVKATASGFDVEFFRPIDAKSAREIASWSVQAYTRDWGGGYATPDSGRHKLTPELISLDRNNRRAHITLPGLKPGYLYELSIAGRLAKSEELWPLAANYWMKKVPMASN